MMPIKKYTAVAERGYEYISQDLESGGTDFPSTLRGWNLDFTRVGGCHILVIMDVTTRDIVAHLDDIRKCDRKSFACRDVASLVSYALSKNERPQIMFTGSGPQFTGTELVQLLRERGISQKVRNSRDGPRLNRLQEGFRLAIDQDIDDFFDKGLEEQEEILGLPTGTVNRDVFRRLVAVCIGRYNEALRGLYHPIWTPYRVGLLPPF